MRQKLLRCPVMGWEELKVMLWCGTDILQSREKLTYFTKMINLIERYNDTKIQIDDPERSSIQFKKLLLSININHPVKGPFPNTVTLGPRASIYEFCGSTIQPISGIIRILIYKFQSKPFYINRKIIPVTRCISINVICSYFSLIW